MDVFTLTLSAAEKNYLAELLESDLEETRVEVRRTSTPSYHADLIRREEMIRGLVEKLRQEHSAAGVAVRS
jgi:hypothetical protein